MDEHGEINILIFNGLTAHDGENQVVPALAKDWTFDEASCTYTFHLQQGVKWHDGEEFTADDVKFTIEAIMDPENGSENAPNYEDVEQITVEDPYTISFQLDAPNVAFLDYMTMAVLPKHLLEGEDMQESDFFRHPVGTGPYKLADWEEGQAITLEKNVDYFQGEPNIDTIIFKIVPDDNAKAIQMQTGELDLALLTPKDAKTFAGKDGFTCYDMKTSDYRGIMFNFQNDYWKQNKDLIPAICYGIDRQAIIDAVILGQGMPAYGPLQRNKYNNENVEHYDYDPAKAKKILEAAGCVMGKDGFYERNGEEIGFVISVGAGDQVRIDMAQAAAQQLDLNRILRMPCQNGCNGNRAGTCSTCHRFAGSALPDTHFYVRAVNDLDKLGVGTVRETLMELEFGSDRLQIQGINLIHKQNGVRISHGNSGKFVFRSIYLDLLRKLGSLLRLAHIDGDRRYFAIFNLHIQIFNPGQCLNRNLRLVHDMVVIRIFSHTADAVAAHRAAGTVQIVHIHAAVCHLRWGNQNQSVGTNSKMAVTDGNRQLLRIVYRFFKTVDIDIIIAKSLHFCKFHRFCCSFCLFDPIVKDLTPFCKD